MISEPVNEFVGLLAEFAGGTLRESESLALILQIAGDAHREDDIAALAFHGKYLTRLLSTMKKQTQGDEHALGLEQEFARAINEFHGMVKSVADAGPEDERRRLEGEFLDVSERALRRLVDLAHDFAWLKNWELLVLQSEREHAAETIPPEGAGGQPVEDAPEPTGEGG